jgi:hypothetical protein
MGPAVAAQVAHPAHLLLLLRLPEQVCQLLLLLLLLRLQEQVCQLLQRC